MRKIAVVVLMAIGGFLFAQDVLSAIAFSGTVNVGLKADISDTSSTLYAWDDLDGAPIRVNFRLDYNYDANAGATVNLRSTGTGQSLGSSGRAIPYINRALAWAKFFDGFIKVRAGYLWDTDYESSYNAWDTLSVLEWCTSVDFFPMDGLEFGVVLPTPLAAFSLMDSLLDLSYGLNWNIKDVGRISAMFQVGSVEAKRSLNFGIDMTAIPNLLIRVEGDCQQLGIETAGYYQLYQEVAYTMEGFTPGVRVYELISKTGASMVVSPDVYASMVVEGVTFAGGLKTNISDGTVGSSQARVFASYKPNKKSTIRVGAYGSMASLTSSVVFSPFVNFVMAF